MVEEKGKYVLLEDAYDRGWMFMKDDDELQACLKDGSMDDGDLVIEVKSIMKVKMKKSVELEEA